jgi:hypothetical protein
MGDVTDMILDGALCKECGALVDGEMPGWPRTCKDCRSKAPARGARAKKTPTPRNKTDGTQQHQ